MSIFAKTKNKEIERKVLVKKTLRAMEKQIERLEEQKTVYINAGKEARQKGLTAQYNLAIIGLKTTILQQKRVNEMKLNFELTSQMKDMSRVTVDFLKGMGAISKEIMKLSGDKDIEKVEPLFNEAMENLESQAERLEIFLDVAQSNFSAGAGSLKSDGEIEKLLDNEAGTAISGEAQSDISDGMIEKELSELTKKMGG